MERTAADQIRPVAREGHPASLGQALEATWLFSRSITASGIRAIGLSPENLSSARASFFSPAIALEVDRMMSDRYLRREPSQPTRLCASRP